MYVKAGTVIAGYFRGTSLNFRGLLKLNISRILFSRIEVRMTTHPYSWTRSKPIFEAVGSRSILENNSYTVI